MVDSQEQFLALSDKKTKSENFFLTFLKAEMRDNSGQHPVQ